MSGNVNATRKSGDAPAALQWTQTEDQKFVTLMGILHEMESVVVAFSGGTDSSFLVAAAHRALGPRALAVTGVSPTFPKRDREDVILQVGAHGWTHRFIETDEVNDKAFAANAPDRCYHCKSELFGKLRRIADAEGYRWMADGSNVDDVQDYRPGVRAKREWQVRSPLQEAAFSKADVREAARRIGLETADKAASACLASRFPYGIPITEKNLRAVEQAEEALGSLGFRQVRVRAHGDVARVEVAPSELERAATEPLRRRITEELRKCGYRYVALDLDGYRMGSMNEVLEAETREQQG